MPAEPRRNAAAKMETSCNYACFTGEAGVRYS